MGNRLWLSIILALAVSFGAVMQTAAQRPDPHEKSGDRPQASPEATPVAPGCDLVVPYTNELYAAIDGSDAFAEFFYSEADFGDLTAVEAEEIIEDGNAMIASLEDLEVPPLYADAHAGIISFMRVNIDMARFFGVDSSVVPDLNAYEKAMGVIYQGEVALAEACPTEIDAIGGYILLDPVGYDEEILPEDVPE